MRKYFVSYRYCIQDVYTKGSDYDNLIVDYPYKITSIENIEDIQKLVKTYMYNKFCHNDIYIKILFFKEVFDE